MRLKNLDLVLVIGIAILNIVLALLPISFPVIKIIAALPLVFVLPGYALTEVLFHKHSLDATHRLVLCLGLSLAIDILSGLIINFLPGGMENISWAIFLAILTVLLSLIASLRRRLFVSKGSSLKLRFNINVSQYIFLGLATIVMILAFSYSIIGAIQQPHPGFTQLWLLPPEQAGQNCNVHLGVRNFEANAETYRLTMSINKAKVTTWPSITLKPQEEWSRLITLPPSNSNGIFIQAQLYRLNKGQAVYREVSMTLPDLRGNKAGNMLPCLMARNTHSNNSIYPVLSNTYSGIMYDLSTDRTTNLSFKRIQQREGNITGNATVDAWMQGDNSFKGTITATKHIQFMITNNTSHIRLMFDGNMLTDGTISGNYCSLNLKERCSSKHGYGLWSVAPTA